MLLSTSSASSHAGSTSAVACAPEKFASTSSCIDPVLSADQKSEIAKQVTRDLSIGHRRAGARLTWIIVDDIASGTLSIGGNQITTDAVKEILAGAPVAV
jgi:phenylpyruvate tautomerase PptA (4-oxalocrotonate tautomerase family)